MGPGRGSAPSARHGERHWIIFSAPTKAISPSVGMTADTKARRFGAAPPSRRSEGARAREFAGARGTNLGVWSALAPFPNRPGCGAEISRLAAHAAGRDAPAGLH